MPRFARLLLLAGAAALAPAATQAQTSPPVKVAVVCQQTFCDTDFLRTELGYVALVREQGDADVQAFVTSDANGAGGRTYTVRLVGTGRFAGRADTYSVPLRADATDDASRRALARTLAAGLMPYLAQSGGLDAVTIAARTGLAPASDAPAVPERDPWNGWVFSGTGVAYFNGDANRSTFETRFYGNASRVTEARIVRVYANARRTLNRFALNDSTTVRSEQTSASLAGTLAHSLGPKTTAGAVAVVRTSTFDNTDVSGELSVGLERSLYPFSESTRRLVTARYDLGVTAVRYADTTVYDRTSELLATQSGRLAVEMRQPWGTVGLFTLADHYLNHPDQFSLSQAGSVDVRLAKGLTFGFYGGVTLTRNRRNIVRRGATPEDVLLQRRALQSGYDYFGGVGVRYTFGSARAAVVNNRFRDGYSISFSY